MHNNDTPSTKTKSTPEQIPIGSSLEETLRLLIENLKVINQETRIPNKAFFLYELNQVQS